MPTSKASGTGTGLSVASKKRSKMRLMTHAEYCRAYYRNNRSAILAQKRTYYRRKKMPEEDLFTAARRLLRDVTADSECEGGLLSIKTEQSADMLRRQIEKEEARRKREAEALEAQWKPDITGTENIGEGD
jgi:hypothetical protein